MECNGRNEGEFDDSFVLKTGCKPNSKSGNSLQFSADFFKASTVGTGIYISFLPQLILGAKGDAIDLYK